VKTVGHSYGITDRIVGTKDFIGVDGEGINLPNGEHKYVLFGVGNNQLESSDDLEWPYILDFVYFEHIDDIAFVGFYLGYDFDRWIRTMSENRAFRLLTTEGREARRSKSPNINSTILPVDMPYGWQIKMLGKKLFEFRHRECDCDIYYCKCAGKGPWVRVCDSGPFFQSSFLKAIDPATWKEPIATDYEYELIKKGKENRADADHVTDEMRFYNRLENEILARLMRVLNAGFNEMKVTLEPRQWFGPGQAAQKWMKNNKITTNEKLKEVVPQWFLESARMSYYGGWFEIMMHGIIPGETYEYDINSAYPYIISTLPCLLHGTYKRGSGEYNGNNGSKEFVLVYAQVSGIQDKGSHEIAIIGTMPHRRSDGKILRPTITEGWYWKHEIDAAIKADLIKTCDVYEWVSYDPCDCPYPMDGIRDLYDKRNSVGKDTPLGKGCKLAYNSMYGKFAQSIGHPIFANPIWASLITAGCRVMILEAIASHPKGKSHVSMVATDAVFFLTPHPELPISNKLGEWDYSIRNNLTQFKPGVYWDDKARLDISEGRDARFKARGIASSDFSRCLASIDAQFKEWDNNPPERAYHNGMVAGWPIQTFITSFAMTSCLQALRRHKWDTAGYVAQFMPVTQNSNPYDKRVGLLLDELEDGRQIWRSEVWSLPIDDCQSKPYEKRFGMDDPWSLENMEDYGITPDGTVLDNVNNLLER
jgi:hypothetical protein